MDSVRAECVPAARFRPARALSVLAGCCLLLVAGSSAGQAQGFLKKLWGGDKESNIDPNFFLEQNFCPTVTVRAGTEVIIIRDKKGDQSPDNIYFQATVNDAARECRYSGDVLSVKLGVAGRVAAGPKGSAGTVTLPVRVVAIKAPDTVIYSQLLRVPVPVPADLLAADFRQVVDFQIPSPAVEKDVRLHVGFDETGKSDPLGTPKKPPVAKNDKTNSRNRTAGQ